MDKSLITEEQFRKVLPSAVSKNVSPDLVVRINRIISDPAVCDNFKENLFGYTNVLKEGKFKLPQYLDAIKYVSYKLLGNTNIMAYTKTFPERYQKLLNSGTSSKDISSYVTSYNKNKLVNLIYEQTLIPSYILNADLYQKALNTQAELMVGARSEKVRTDAANSILNHLKMPDKSKLELDINIKQDSTLDDLRATTKKLVEQQKSMLITGYVDAEQVAHSRIVEAEYEEVDK